MTALFVVRAEVSDARDREADNAGFKVVASRKLSTTVNRAAVLAAHGDCVRDARQLVVLVGYIRLQLLRLAIVARSRAFQRRTGVGRLLMISVHPERA